MAHGEGACIVRKPVVEDHGNEPGLPLRKPNPPLRPALLKRLDLVFRFKGVRRRHRGKEGAEFGRGLPAEHRPVLFQSFQIQKQEVLSLGGRRIRGHGDPVSQKAKGGDAAIVAGEGPVLNRPLVLHRIGIVFGKCRRCLFKPLCQPFRFHTGVEPIHTGHEALNTVVPNPRLPQRLLQKIPGDFLRQVGILHGSLLRLRRLPASGTAHKNHRHQRQKCRSF